MWIDNFMNTIENDVIIFTNQEMYDFFSYRYGKDSKDSKDSKNSKDYKDYKNFRFFIRNITDLYYYRYFNIFCEQNKIDPELNIVNRTPELYLLWYNKLRFIEELCNYPEFDKYDNFIWCDIGCFREKFFPCRKNFCKYLKGLDKVNVLQLIVRGNNKICGGIIAIPKIKIKNLIELQDSVFLELINQENQFFGCDQICYTKMYDKEKDLFNVINVPENYLGDPWFYPLNYFSTKKLKWNEIINSYFELKNNISFYDYIFSFIDRVQRLNILVRTDVLQKNNLKEYFNTSNIFGIDNDDKDNKDLKVLLNDIPPLDIIIENKFHEDSLQYLKKEGIYICENYKDSMLVLSNLEFIIEVKNLKDLKDLKNLLFIIK